MRRHDVAAGCTTYEHNVRGLELAIECGIHWCDLGGNDDVTERQLAMAPAAEARGVRFAMACGIAPGACGTLLQRAIEEAGGAGNAQHALILCGGLQQEPKGLLRYSPEFSVRGLTNECIEKVTELRGGRPVTMESMGTVTTHDFSALGLGMLEASPTSGALVQAVRTYQNMLDTVSYQTLRYPGKDGTWGFWQYMKAWRDAGCFREDLKDAGPDGVTLSARDQMEKYLAEVLPPPGPDLLVMRVEVEARCGDHVRYDLLVKHDPVTGLSAMQQTTGFSLAVVMALLARGTVTKTGAILHERDIPTHLFLATWARAGIVPVRTTLTA
jgi:lysine 6-dehydrogenase